MGGNNMASHIQKVRHGSNNMAGNDMAGNNMASFRKFSTSREALDENGNIVQGGKTIVLPRNHIRKQLY